MYYFAVAIIDDDSVLHEERKRILIFCDVQLSDDDRCL